MPRCFWCSNYLVDGKCLLQCFRELAEDEPLPVPVWRKYVDPE